MNGVAIGNKLVSLRGKRSQEMVAQKLGISVSALSMYEQGNRIPRDEIKIKIANYYGQTVQEIFFAEQLHELCNCLLVEKRGEKVEERKGCSGSGSKMPLMKS